MEVACFSKILIENFNLSTEFFNNSLGKEKRRIMMKGEKFEKLQKIYSKENPEVFTALGGCFQTPRKKVFTKTDEEKGEFVDVHLFSQYSSYNLIVDPQLKKQLG